MIWLAWAAGSSTVRCEGFGDCEDRCGVSCMGCGSVEGCVAGKFAI